MKQAAKFVSLAALAGLSQANEETPVAKIVTMLGDMKKKCVDEKNAEEVQYATYETWCKTEVAAKKRDIENGKDAIRVAEANVDSNEALAEKLSMKIAALQESRDGWTKEKESATATRKEEREAYETLHRDYSESISATSRAVKVLKKEVRSQDQKGHVISLLATSQMIPETLLTKVGAFLSTYHEASEEDPGTYKVVSMLSELKDKFFDERSELEKDEFKKKAAFDMLALELSNSMKTASNSIDSKTSEKNGALSRSAKAKSELKDASATKADDEKYSESVSTQCKKKAEDFTSRTEIRKEELAAIDKAVEVLSGKELQDAVARRAGLIQAKKGTSLAALRRGNVVSPQLQKVSQYLQAQADKIDSSLLGTAAHRAEGAPLERVRSLINNLITKLKEQGDAATEHHEWCSKEIDDNRQTRSTTTLEIEDLTAAVNAADSRAAKLSSEMADLNARLAEMAASLNNATATRKAEKTENELTIKDAEVAQEAIKGAQTVLKEFYAKAAKQEVFLQIKQPEIFDKAYKGGAERGVLDLLDVIHTEYVNLEANTQSSEENSQKAFDEMEVEVKALKTDLEKDNDDKNGEKVDTLQTKTVKSRDLESSQKSLEAANEYFEKLKKDCLDNGPSHEEKEARRKEEIASLKEALAMLSAE
eukprot:TRINITY_DN78824_c0_g1_i1.p1 TRINITY_DN78824_c0_g1~~TRINITY_DN78824_c0_g1_i1.p1  ORF type:complete len:652 (+),score=218.84 TRINITY_DN78824_c0_g1_i1:86-2041(+)